MAWGDPDAGGAIPDNVPLLSLGMASTGLGMKDSGSSGLVLLLRGVRNLIVAPFGF